MNEEILVSSWVSTKEDAMRFSHSDRWERPVAAYLRQTALTRTLTTDQLETSPVSFFQTINCTSGFLLFGWPGDKISVFLSQFLCSSVVSFCCYGNPVDGCFLLMVRQSRKLLLSWKSFWEASWQWLILQESFTRYLYMARLMMLSYMWMLSAGIGCHIYPYSQATASLK